MLEELDSELDVLSLVALEELDSELDVLSLDELEELDSELDVLEELVCELVFSLDDVVSVIEEITTLEFDSVFD